MNTKICSKCEKEKNVEEFCKRYGKPQPWCKECNRIRSRQYYKENKEKQKKQIRLRNKALNDAYLLWKDELVCSCCEEDYGRCLHLHHLDPNEKDLIISNILYNVGIDKAIDEIKKCVVVCGNCHIKVHDGIINLPVDVNSDRIANRLKVLVEENRYSIKN